MKTQNLKLDKRNKDMDIVFTGQPDPGQNDDGTITNGSTVTLKCEGVTIRVAVNDASSPKCIKGNVLGFVGHDGPEFSGYQTGDEIEFQLGNVFTCEHQSIAA